MKTFICGLFILMATSANAAFSPELSSWLDSNPMVKNSMVWTECATPGNPPANDLTYDQWPTRMKELLHAAYQTRVSGQFIEVKDPPPVPEQTLIPDRSGSAVANGDRLSPASAMEIYIAHLAQTFWWERHGYGLWSVLDLKKDGLDVLFNSRSMFGPLDCGGHFGGPLKTTAFVMPDHYRVTPGDPAISYRYLKDRNLIRATRRETIAQILNWAHTHAIHASGFFGNLEVRQGQWQYNGPAPVSRILEGTYIPQDIPGAVIQDNRKVSRIPGCRGFTRLLAWVLRTVNIPVSDLEADRIKTGHSITHFISEDLYLSHGDDWQLDRKNARNGFTSFGHDPINNATLIANDWHDLSCLFIDQKTHDEWFVIPDKATAINNLGKGVEKCFLSSPQNFSQPEVFNLRVE